MPFKFVDEFLALTGPEAPTSAERALIDHCRAGTRCSLSDTRPTAPTEANTIRAPLLRLLITGGTETCGLDARGILLEGAWVTGKLELSHCTARGQTVLELTHFEENPNLTSANLKMLCISSSQMPGLTAPALKLAGSIIMDSAVLGGLLDLRGVEIYGKISAEKAVIDGEEKTITAGTKEGRVAIDLEGAKVKDSLLVAGASISGLLNLNGAKIGGIFDARQSSFVEAARSISAYRANIAAGFWFSGVKEVSGVIDLSSASTGDLRDDLMSWPKDRENLTLDGFVYERFAGDAPVTFLARRAWLEAGSSGKGDFRPQPYTQFARTLRAMGNFSEARKVLFERDCLLFEEAKKADLQAYDVARNGNQRSRADMGPIWCRLLLRGFWSWLSRITVGHGHKPERAVGCIAALWSLAAFLSWLTWQTGSFAPNSDVILTSNGWMDVAAQGCVAGDRPGCVANPAEVWSGKNAPGMDWDSFNALAYGLDLVLPLVDLGQTAAWAPSKDRGWLGCLMWWGRWILTLAGWVVTSLGLAAVTGFVQKNVPQ